MKFTYPAKLYLGGLLYFSLFAILGFYTICIMTQGQYILKLIYILTFVILVDWYYKNYLKYKDRYITITKEEIIINTNQKKETIKKEVVECIINADHHQLFKIHNVVHLFTADDRYYYFTNELNNYSRFKHQLQESFPTKFYEINKTIRKTPINKLYLQSLIQK